MAGGGGWGALVRGRRFSSRKTRNTLAEISGVCEQMFFDGCPGDSSRSLMAPEVAQSGTNLLLHLVPHLNDPQSLVEK